MLALDALGNAVRRDIVLLLRSQPASVGELAQRFPVSRPAISRHLRVLEDARLVRHRSDGRRNVYTVDPRGFAEVAAWLGPFWDEALLNFQQLVEQEQP